MFPIFSHSDAPLPLKPSMPASAHMLQYTQYKKTQMQQNVQRSRQSNLLLEIEKLSEILRSQEQEFKIQKQSIMNNIILLSLEVEHMREIHSQYDYQLKSSQETCADLQQMYELKLQQIKAHLAQNFQMRIQAEKEKTLHDFLQLKQIYGNQIVLISQSNESKELQIQMKSQQASQHALKIELYQCKVIEKQRQIVKYTERISILQQQNNQLIQRTDWLQKKVQQQQEEASETISSLKVRSGEAHKLNQETHQQLLQMKSYCSQMQGTITNLGQQLTQTKTQLQTTLRRFNKLQKQLDELNRKTFKNKQIPQTIVQPRKQLQTERDRQRQMLMRQSQNSPMINNKDTMVMASRIKDLEQIVTEKEEEIQKLIQQRRIQDENHQIKQQQFESILESKRKQTQQQQLRPVSNNGEIQDLQESLAIAKEEVQDLSLKIKQLQAIIDEKTKIIKEKQKNIKQKESVIDKKQDNIQQLRKELISTNQQYGQRIIFFNKRITSLEIEWREKQKQMKLLQKNIQNQYLKEISALKNQVEGLEKTLVDTNSMFENMEIERNQGKKKEGKKKGK